MTATELAPLLKAQILFATVWPLVLPLVMLAILRSRIAKRGAFYVVSSLVNFGIAPLVGLAMINLPLPTIEQAASPEGTLRHVFLTSMWLTAFLSLLLSIPFSIWLSRFFGEQHGV